MEEKLEKIKKEVKKELKEAKEILQLERLWKKYLGKKGVLKELLKSLKNLPLKERRKIGQKANLLKEFLEEELRKKRKKIKLKEIAQKEKKEWFDITIPGKKPSLGHLHPLTIVQEQIEDIFAKMGFILVEGPEIEKEWYNFDALNIPPDHPARDMWNTFWIELPNSKKEKFLLRTHTSPVQIRYMEKNNPPLRIITLGRCFRHEATDFTHDLQFYQLEGLMVDKNVSVANFKGVIEEFFKNFFKKEVQIRLRASYFPFTEPSFEVEILCLNCQGKGCFACKKTGFLEIMGAGMVHPQVFKAVGYNPKNWQGFAFGLGVDRLAMIKYKINDIRLFYKGDLRFLEQF